MSQRITRMISLNRDNIMQITQRPDFFEKMPALANLIPLFDECRAAFDESAKKSGCRCRADTTVLFNCVSPFLVALEKCKETDPETVQQFVRYIAKDENVESTGVTIYYSAPNETTPQRYMFP
jgi:hypothetical protein